jgi:DNA end-binding protein Ku
MAATVWKGYITFGLISVPVRLFTAARGERVGFNQLHRECNTRIRQQLFCPTCNRTVERSEIIKGYEYSKDQYVLVEEKEIKQIAPESADAMEIMEFVKLEEVDPLYFESSFYATPEEAGRKAYHLLTDTMHKLGYAAIAKLTMHQREYTVLIRSRDNGLTLHTMYYPNEIRAVAEYGRDANFEVKPQEAKLAEQLIESLAASFEPEKYSDAYQQRLKELVEAKREGKEITPTEGPKLAPVIDLMAALQESLKRTPKKAPSSAMESFTTTEATGSKGPSARKKSRKAAH